MLTQMQWMPGQQLQRYLVDLVRELSCLLVVDRVRVKQGAKGLEVCLLLQQRDKVISVGGESGWNDFPDLPFNIIRLCKHRRYPLLNTASRQSFPRNIIQEILQT